MKITGIKKRGGRHNRCSIFIDGRFAFSTTNERVSALNLRVGRSLTESEMKRILLEEEREQALEYAFLLLSYRPRTEKEVTQRLKRKKFSSGTIDAIIKKLHQEKYIDDFAFSKNWIEDRLRKNPRGTKALYMELSSKGVRQDTAKKALEDIFGRNDFDEEGLAWRSIEKRISYYRRLERDKARRRVYNFLLRRGFSKDVIENITRKIFKIQNSEDDELISTND